MLGRPAHYGPIFESKSSQWTRRGEIFVDIPEPAL